MLQRMTLQSKLSCIKYGEHHNKNAYKYRKQLFVTDPDGIQTEHVKAN